MTPPDETASRQEMMPRERATLQAIARAAGVSPTTVSNVVNGKFAMMGAETRENIQRLIGQMNYRPHAAGRSLRLARRQSIGLIIVDESPTFLADPFITHIAAGLSNHLNRNGFGLVVNGLAADRLAESFLIRNHETDALCVIPSGSPEERATVYRQLADLGQPVLVFEESPPAVLHDVIAVRQDDREGGRMMTARAIDHGARKLVLLLPERAWPQMIEREQGVRAAVAAADGIELHVLYCGGEGIEDTQAALESHCGMHGVPDAIVGGNDQMAIAALKWAQARGLRVPGDVRITGFNGFAFAQYTTPTLTTIRSPAYEMGERGGELLLERLAVGGFRQREVVLAVTLQEGGSG